MNNPPTKEGILAGAGGVILACAVGVAILVGIVLGLQSLVFDTQNRSQAHQVTLLKIQGAQFQASPSAQAGDLSDISSKLQQVLNIGTQLSFESTAQQAGQKALRFQLTQEICADTVQLNDMSKQLPAAELTFVNLHCIGGAANPSERNNY